MTVRQATSSGVGAFFRTGFNLFLVPMKFLIFGFMGLFMETSTRSRRVLHLKFKLPWCDRCGARHRPKVTWTDYNEGTVTLVVPLVVRERLNQMREGKSS